MEKTSRKRLLILGGAVQTLKVVKRAQELGIYTIVTDIQEKTEAKLAADEALPFSVMDAEAIIDWCEQHPVDGVLNFNNDFAQHSHQKICEHFHFPNYGTKEQYDYLTSKEEFKKLCLRNGINVIPEYSEAHLEEIEFPVLVKPCESSGSRGGGICSNKDELRHAVSIARSVSRNQEVIIEKYLSDYPDVELSYLVVKGTPYLLYAGTRILGKKEYGLNQQCVCFVSPTNYLNVILGETHPKICQMLRNLGIKNGPVFFQGFVDGDIVRLYDPAIRFPGDEFVSVVKELTGIDFVEAMIRYALTGDMGLDGIDLEGLYQLNNHYGALYYLQASPGVLFRYEGLEEIRRLPSTVAAVQKRFVGDTIDDVKDLRRRIGEIAIKGDSGIDSIVTAIRQARALLHVEDANGNNMLVDSFDLEKLN